MEQNDSSRFEFSTPSTKNENFIVHSHYFESSMKYGYNGTYFTLPLVNKFENGDIITPDYRNAPSLHITNEEIKKVEIEPGVFAWDHIVVLSHSNRKVHFFPNKYLKPGVIFYKIPTKEELSEYGTQL